MNTLVQSVIKECGGGAALARKLKRTRQAIYAWKRIPLDHVHAIVEMTDGKFTLEQLRPDTYRAA